ncbi:hypothetical protein Pmani_000255 [Petrolisthes manimaculis]|uniref:Uncharacterized protein n=1 Tax=Petrolisthes manimaculis TaxID=1843537 RepID=A0AAE1QMH1_9EUCA|nr:hypothetical protein Pmani_000255 [Petrolisthes manimaculis]
MDKSETDTQTVYASCSACHVKACIITPRLCSMTNNITVYHTEFPRSQVTIPSPTTTQYSEEEEEGLRRA